MTFARIQCAALIAAISMAAADVRAWQVAGVPPIPTAEQFTHGTGLRIRLTMRSTSLAAFEDPGFVAIFENVGSTPLYLNPRVAHGIRIYDDGGQFVRPRIEVWAELPLLPSIVRADRILVRPGSF